MKGRSYYIRKTHRYLGVIIGVQFLMWTLGGLYFSWTNLDEIHGDHFRVKAPSVELHDAAPLADAVRAAGVDCERSDLTKMRIVSILDESFYALSCDGAEGVRSLLIRTTDGSVRSPVSEADARAIAARQMANPYEVEAVEPVTNETVGKHHEYREKPLPAWAVSFKNADGLTAYVSASDGQIHAMRTNSWRAFDLLWMLHTMDFAGRDNINNSVLRAFSVLGLATVISGFLLFFVSSKPLRYFFRSTKTSTSSRR